MRIGELAARSGVSRRLLRYYEEQGLLRPVRGLNGYRDYADSDVATVRNIRALLDAGLPTAVIGKILDCVHEDGERLVPAPCPGMVDHLNREHARISDSIAGLQASQRALGTLLSAAVRPTEPGKS
ncbi:MerR family transcriptional regulator [Streptomyces sp. NPDC050658]|uniref:MerR family transcriptional regulator n=1 Tax=unclassified Streptomyces TaxID=2593676 RepID=UPI0034447FEB